MPVDSNLVGAVERPPLHPNTNRRRGTSPAGTTSTNHHPAAIQEEGDATDGSNNHPTRRGNSNIHKIAAVAVGCLLLASLITLPHFQPHRTIITNGANAIIGATSSSTTPSTPSEESASHNVPSSPATGDGGDGEGPTAVPPTPPKNEEVQGEPPATGSETAKAPRTSSAARSIPAVLRAKGSWFRLPFSLAASLPSGCYPYASTTDVRVICMGEVSGGGTAVKGDSVPPPLVAKVTVEETQGEDTRKKTETSSEEAPPAPLKQKRSATAETTEAAEEEPETDVTTARPTIATPADDSVIPEGGAGDAPAPPKRKGRKGRRPKRVDAGGDDSAAATEPPAVAGEKKGAEGEEGGVEVAAARKMKVAAVEEVEVGGGGEEDTPATTKPAAPAAVKFPLHFKMEYDARVVPLKVICTRGCTKASISEEAGGPTVKRQGESTTVSVDVVVASLEDLDPASPCASLMKGMSSVEPISSLSSVCFFGFDFEVRMEKSKPSMPPALPAPVCFLSVGDWGSSPGVDTTAYAMTKEAAQGADFIKFIISTGDNFYPTGVKSVKDPHWENTFETPFCHPALAFVRWFICAGNHDQWGLKPQLSYGKLFNTKPVASPAMATENGRKCPSVRPPGFRSRWYFPSKTYSSDTPMYDVVVGEEGKGGSKAAQSSSIRIVTLDTYGREVPKQIAFADGTAFTAGAADATSSDVVRSESWRLMLNHAPVFSGSNHGQQPRTPVLRATLKPILQKHKVHMYLNGDDHVLEILRDPPQKSGAAAAAGGEEGGWATDYFVNGAGGGAHLYQSIDLPQTVWRQGNEKIKGFMKHCVESVQAEDGKMFTELVTTAIQDDNAVLYTHRTPYLQE